MRGITYLNTKSTIPNFDNTIHIRQPRGYAYEADSHFIHFYASNSGLHTISIGLTVLEEKKGSLENWVLKTFGATDIKPLSLQIGEATKGVWRPALYFENDILTALGQRDVEQRLAEQALKMLVDKLDEVFLYIEPDNNCLNTYSHKTRELLILACTEVENSWKHYIDLAQAKPINGKTFTTNDYVKLVDKLFLNEYQFSLRSYDSLAPFRPFQNWNKSNPTTSLHWYDAYNKTKHDRTKHFNLATLNNCINAITANLVMHSVRFSPFFVSETNSLFSSLISQHFHVELVNPDVTSFYLYDFEIPQTTRKDLFILSPDKVRWKWKFTQMPLTL